jgi:hypothetical protein
MYALTKSILARITGKEKEQVAGMAKQNLLTMIQMRMPEFSKGQKQIANYILSHYEKAAYMTASKLGGLVGVSESTVVRFAIELGFEGYPELQRALQELIRTKLTSFQRIEVANNLIGDGDMLEKVLMSDAERIRHTLDLVDRDVFNAESFTKTFGNINIVLNTLWHKHTENIFLAQRLHTHCGGNT